MRLGLENLPARRFRAAHSLKADPDPADWNVRPRLDGEGLSALEAAVAIVAVRLVFADLGSRGLSLSQT